LHCTIWEISLTPVAQLEQSPITSYISVLISKAPRKPNPEIHNMSTTPEKESAENKPEEYEVKIVPEGTFAGHIDKPELVKKGEVIPEDTGDQGGGQN
jgi:hypothetical protein